MISKTDLPGINENRILRRSFLSKLMALGGVGLLMAKLMPKTAHADVVTKKE